MPKARLELDHHTVFWRTAGLVFLLSLLTDWTSRPRPMRPGRRILFSLFSLPKSLIVGLVASTVITMLAWVVVRAILRPLVERWHSPTSEGAPAGFHLASNEWVIQSCPARKATGWTWQAGTLVRTNLRLWFFPRLESSDVWACPLETVSEIRLEAAPQVAWGLIRNWPDRVAVHSLPDDVDWFAVIEPRAVLTWLEPAPSPRKPDAVWS